LGVKGFTLIEMLVVLVLIALSIGIVYPVGWRLVQQFEGRMERADLEQEKKQREFMAFIRDERRGPATPGTMPEQ
jgi:prepilin-type N-terminal cleavage/methylation domain-containing protein